MQFILKTLPPTTNASFKVGRGRFYQTQAYKDYKMLVRNKVQPKPVQGDVSMQVDFYVKRDCDIDGRLKCLLDALNGLAYEDDRQVIELIVTKNKGEDQVVVEVTSLARE